MIKEDDVLNILDKLNKNKKLNYSILILLLVLSIFVPVIDRDTSFFQGYAEICSALFLMLYLFKRMIDENSRLTNKVLIVLSAISLIIGLFVISSTL